MTTFIIFVAPFLVLIASIAVTFFVAPRDKSIPQEDR